MLSPHFSENELTKSQLARRLGIDNSPTPAARAALQKLAAETLEAIRSKAREILPGAIIAVSSGYRCATLNRVVGGSPSSQHVRGEAADIEVPGICNLALAEMIRDSGIDFDQLILEFHNPAVPDSGWVHVSLASSGKQRRQVLRAERHAGGTRYLAGLTA